MRRELLALLVSLAACSPAPSPSARAPSPVPTAIPSATAASREPTRAPIASPAVFVFDVENRSRVPVVVSVASDAEATMPGFEPGDKGTISIMLKNPTNGIGVEVQREGCHLLAKGIYPTPEPFTLLIDDAAEAGEIQLQTVAGASSTPLPLPVNSLRGCGG